MGNDERGYRVYFPEESGPNENSQGDIGKHVERKDQDFLMPTRRQNAARAMNELYRELMRRKKTD